MPCVLRICFVCVRHACFQVWIVGEPGAALTPSGNGQHLLLKLQSGAPPVHISKLHLQGRLVVEGGELELTDCSISPRDNDGLSQSAEQRAMSIVGGFVLLVRTTLSNHLQGALAVHSAMLSLFECIIRDCRAQAGPAILISGTANVTCAASRFIDNAAEVSGGALQVSLDQLDWVHSSTPSACCHAAHSVGMVTPLHLSKRRLTVGTFASTTRRFLCAIRLPAEVACPSSCLKAEQCSTRCLPHQVAGLASARAPLSISIPVPATWISLMRAALVWSVA